MKRRSQGSGNQEVDGRRLWRAAPAAALAAAAVNSLVYAIAESAGALPNDVLVPTAGGEKPLSLSDVLFATILPLIAGAIVLAVVARFARRPLRVFWSVSLVVLVLSLGSPMSLPDAPSSMVTALSLMHLVAACVGLPVLTKLARPGTDGSVLHGEQIRQRSAASPGTRRP